MDGGAGGIDAAAGPIPGEAHPVLWAVVLGALSIWWLWPWVQLACWRPAPAPKEVSKSFAEASAAGDDLDASSAGAASNLGYGASLCPQNDSCDAGERSDCDEEAEPSPALDFDPRVVFDDTFDASARLVGEALEQIPRGFSYMEATAAIHRVVAVLDKLLQAWGRTDEEMLRVASLNENSEAFGKAFGQRSGGQQARALLELAGFARQADGEPSTASNARWVFPPCEPLARLKALTVRLCLRKHTDLQRLRGTLKWTQDGNAAVIPKREDASLVELLGLYRQLKPVGLTLEAATLRERTLEAAVRSHLTKRRATAGNAHALALHEGLAGAARVLAQDRRLYVRTRKGDIGTSRGFGKAVNSKVRKLLATCPLPPGFHAAHLHWQSDELPRLFGLSDSRGGGSAMEGAGEEAAEILAQEAVATWAARQDADVTWPCAAIIGVGAALDYTLNRGFVVALIAGFEGLVPEDEAGGPSNPSSLLQPGGSSGSRKGSGPAPEPSLFGAKRSFGAKVRTLGSGGSETPLHKK
eukprot:TRINITY_DN14121_c0_g9_i1.p1 TRINITY_DN14121_c0_g9~~TRINITY_DN14121_c0_g9_i1.p1  ORF type:complete len:527 (-),score=117.34 TRINITY_DN14121_c0_g9_i1:115-1695(-)